MKQPYISSQLINYSCILLNGRRYLNLLLVFIILLIAALDSFSQTNSPFKHWEFSDGRLLSGGGLATDWTLNVTKTSDEGYICVGYTSIDNLGITHAVPALYKVDAHGQIEWNKEYPDGKPEYFGQFHEVIEVSDGYVAVGFKAHPADSEDVLRKIFLIKTDFNGNEITKLYIGYIDSDNWNRNS